MVASPFVRIHSVLWRVMKKPAYIIITCIVMLIVSRFVIRIVDATVQIDDDIGLLLLLLAAVNAVIGLISYKLYHAKRK